jgi:hypothetical protein
MLGEMVPTVLLLYIIKKLRDEFSVYRFTRLCNRPVPISFSLLYYKIYAMRNSFILMFLGALFFSCSNNKQPDNISSATKPERSIPGNRQSVGSLSFKLNGELFEADPANAKAWTSTGVPLAMMMAKNDKGLSVSMQVHNMKGEGAYKLDSDSDGGMSITVNGKTYGIRSVMKDDYINVVISGSKTLGPVLLLSGTFEGVLEDKDGNKVQITEGRFTTESI